MNKNILLSILFILIFIPLVIFTIVTVNSYMPTIQFIINPTHKPTPTEEVMLKSAHRNPSPAEFNVLYQSVIKIAHHTPYIEIGRCAPYPRVANVLINTNLKFVNSDTISHTITFTPHIKLTLKPKEKENIYVDFYKYLPVPYGYTCDNSKEPVGILFIF